MSDTMVIDCKGTRIAVGNRVLGDPAQPGGEVISITDPDGDVDDEGRPYGINPYVYVQWDDTNDREAMSTTWTAKHMDDQDAPYQCDDLEVVPA